MVELDKAIQLLDLLDNLRADVKRITEDVETLKKTCPLESEVIRTRRSQQDYLMGQLTGLRDAMELLLSQKHYDWFQAMTARLK